MLNVLYAGSPEAAAEPLNYIAKSGKHRVVGVLTNPPSVQRRGKEPIATPVAQVAAALNAENPGYAIQVFTPNKLSEVYDKIAALNADILVCFAYGKIFSSEFLSFFKYGGINLHPSLLPLYRGCAPVPAAILHRDRETGITVQRIVREMDSGDILLQTHIPLTGRETTQSLLQTVSNQGGELLVSVLDAIEGGTVSPVPQNHAKATYFGMLKKEDGCIDWNDSAPNIEAKIRAFNPWPSAFTHVGGVQLAIHEATVFDEGTGARTDTDAMRDGNCSAAHAENNAVAGAHDGEKTANTENAKAVARANDLPHAAAGTVLGVDKQHGILIQTGAGVLAVQNLQWQTKRAMNWKDFMNGSRNFIGSLCE